jgi:transposase-like protein
VNGHEKVTDEKLTRRLAVRRVVGRNCTYDGGAKRELIELCQSGTVSVPKVAQIYGIYPNLVPNWINLYRTEGVGQLPAP